MPPKKIEESKTKKINIDLEIDSPKSPPKQAYFRRLAASKLRNACEELELAVSALKAHDVEESASIKSMVTSLQRTMKRLCT